MSRLLQSIIENNRNYTRDGQVASYIPELAKANRDALGIYICSVNGEEEFAGDFETKFTMQSISKIISLMVAILDNGADYVFSKVGVDSTSDAFNSIVNLEIKNPHKPLNPMINAGAIDTVGLIEGKNSEEVFNKIMKFTRMITDNNDIAFNQDVYKSEKLTGDRNRALAYFMRSTGVIMKDVEEVLDVYFKQCSMEVTCRDIARMGAMLANDGVMPWNGKRAIPRHVAKIIKTIMVTCGMYDGSGDFAVNVGVPAKSGVGGGILAAVPGRMGIGVIGPSLDIKGNSIAGIKVLEDLSKEFDLSIF